MLFRSLSEKFADAARFLDSFQLTTRTGTEATSTTVPPPDWKPYQYPSDGFSAAFPHEPALQKQNLATDAGTFEFRIYSTEDSAAAFIVAVCDYGSMAESKDPDILLDAAKTGAVNNVKGHLLSERKITLGANHGIEFQAANDSTQITARVYLAGATLYQLIVTVPLKSDYADTARFLDSLQLIPRGGK